MLIGDESKIEKEKIYSHYAVNQWIECNMNLDDFVPTLGHSFKKSP